MSATGPTRKRAEGSVRPAPTQLRKTGGVALAVARNTGKRVGIDTASRMASDANFASDLETFASPPRASYPEIDPLDEPDRLISVKRTLSARSGDFGGN